MKTIRELRLYEQYQLITEALHPSIQAAIDSNIHPKHKLKAVAAAIKKVATDGEDTGLEHGNKPKKGSSRAVYFPKDEHKYNLDGKEAKSKTVVKVAYPGALDKYNRSGALLGEHQNNTEADHYINQQHGMLHRDEHGNYHTNHEHGVLAPMFEAHHDGHYIHHGRVRPLKKGDFRKLTKTPEHPDGISHDELYCHLNNEHERAHGRPARYMESDEQAEHTASHPLVRKMHHFIANAGQHPGDLVQSNLGVWKHPHTGKEHIVVADYGFSHEVAKHYQEAAREKVRHNIANRRW